MTGSSTIVRYLPFCTRRIFFILLLLPVVVVVTIFAVDAPKSSSGNRSPPPSTSLPPHRQPPTQRPRTGQRTVFTLSQFSTPHSVAVDGRGTIYFSPTDTASVFYLPQDVDTPLLLTNLRNKVTSLAVTSGGDAVYIGMSLEVWRWTSTESGQFYPVNSAKPRVAIDAATNVFLAVSPFVETISGSHDVRFIGIGFPGYRDGPLDSAQFNDLTGIAVKRDGSAIYVADNGNHRIRKIEGGLVSTLSGSGQNGFQDGVAAQVRFGTMSGLALSADQRTLFVVDQIRIRAVSVNNGSVWTVAGDGIQGGRDGPALAARFSAPSDIAISPDGDLLVADSNGMRLIMMS